MLSIRQGFTSPAFMKDLSGLLLLLTGITAFVGIGSLLAATNEDEMVGAIGIVLGAIVYVIIAIKVRRGSVIALYIAGTLFLLDTIVSLGSRAGRIPDLKSEIRNRKLDVSAGSAVQFKISSFGFEMQDSSN